ncbi:MAG: hypothetical protein A2934_00800 [Candidatus Sungbacteria bacterium RIFCSPLOWO2_01_FULL_47_10]|uniref:Methyltransferase type 11 domain-containing protein n=1 Tax=Candidatus Sungbacteria bacterium RIFCSPLOWO2_01_FULL_47_10 TaxID=1802276 RepID=A0A1G2L136_9BACT|nr:MAG: hypothetical protein A2934_00800 [Candidatus Sungbacteria bacterium RIFCSPLOWO2_01_FULL_47_10]
MATRVSRSKKKEAFFEEAKRILKKGGSVIVKETNTPLKEDLMIRLAEKHGFAVKKNIHLDSPEWKREISVYDKVARTYPLADGSSYLAEFIRNNDR